MTHFFPGLLPWHFGGDGALTYTEARSYQGWLVEAHERRRTPGDGSAPAWFSTT